MQQWLFALVLHLIWHFRPKMDTGTVCQYTFLHYSYHHRQVITITIFSIYICKYSIFCLMLERLEFLIQWGPQKRKKQLPGKDSGSRTGKKADLNKRAAEVARTPAAGAKIRRLIEVIRKSKKVLPIILVRRKGSLLAWTRRIYRVK